MTATIQGWAPETERSFKETLFRFLEEVNSTKAALYLLAPDGAYLLATQYGFGRRESLSVRHESRSRLVLKARELRDKPLIVNHRDESPELFRVLDASGSTRMLLTPVFGDSRLVAFVDAREKGRKRPFLDEDVTAAQAIAGDLMKLVRVTGVVADLEPEVREQPAQEKVARPQKLTEGVPQVDGVVLDLAGLEQLHRCFSTEVARAPEVGLAALTMVDGSEVGGRVSIVESVGNDEVMPLLYHQAEVLKEKGFDLPGPDTWNIQVIKREDHREETGPQVVASSILLFKSRWAVVVGAVGCAETGAASELIDRLAQAAQQLSEQAAVRLARNRLARGLLRPPGREFPHLESHALSVSRLAWIVAQGLALPREHCETAALAGLLHDIGMVELDYENMYRMKAPGPDERRTYRNHVLEGERIVGEAGLFDVQKAVRNHHERWDGRGYPDGLVGEAIPLVSRIVHVAEVWDVLTSQESYRRPVPAERAVETMRSEGGRQFDPRVVDALLRVI